MRRMRGPGWPGIYAAVTDGGYGDTVAFRLGLEERGLDCAVGISTTATAQPEGAQPCTPACSGRGRRPVPTAWAARWTPLPGGPAAGSHQPP
ncbi:transposase [Streptomyces sp. ITFR-16]|uniref:transposase n=1 Tax=Streptomyces sp. ITFR-16 TaxID=3075198 RepID=UPI0037D9FA7E